ncbi:alanine racemase [Lentilitoribacter sp. EG35]|uniref:alanine racemase n=1 Tax=Lentilitoribacter sp. EG35 TaxID=3234192 RepID=UPI00345F9BC3
MTINLTPTVRLTIDTNAIARNFQQLKNLSGSARCGAAVKANAYGCGIDTVVPILLNNGCADFFVADAVEGELVRRLAPSSKIYILSGYLPQSRDKIITSNLIPIIGSAHQLEQWQKLQRRHPFAIQFNTGMNRIGIQHSDANSILDNLSEKPDLILSHFANADEPEDIKNEEQLKAFSSIVSTFTGIEASMANSAAVITNPDSHFHLTRPGIAIYGGNPLIDRANPMEVVFKLEAQIIDIKTVAKGESISYGGTFIAPQNMTISTLGIGYADGLPRSASGHGVPARKVRLIGMRGFVKGHHIPNVGRITMDISMFDCSSLKNNSINIGDWVEITGKNITIDELAEASGTVSYEILTNFGRARHKYS